MENEKIEVRYFFNDVRKVIQDNKDFFEAETLEELIENVDTLDDNQEYVGLKEENKVLSFIDLETKENIGNMYAGHELRGSEIKEIYKKD